LTRHAHHLAIANRRLPRARPSRHRS
jgi:hypothetical protein